MGEYFESEVTPQMIEAGADVIERIGAVVSREYLAAEVYRTMGCLSRVSRPQNPSSSKRVV